jgi:hypothetical protein
LTDDPSSEEDADAGDIDLPDASDDFAQETGATDNLADDEEDFADLADLSAQSLLSPGGAGHSVSHSLSSPGATPFSVVVDHQALLYLVKGQGRLTNRKILNMLMNLQEFRFSVIYRDGLRHLDADAISRLLHYQDNGETLMLEMNGSSLPVTPDIPIALMRKIL